MAVAAGSVESCEKMVGAVTGYYLGAHFTHQIPQARVRQIVTAIGFIISGLTFYKEFGW